MSFKTQYDYNSRFLESSRVLDKYSDKIPVIITKQTNSNLPDIKKNKYLIAETITIAQLLHIIRKHVKMDKSEALYIMINGNVLPLMSSSIASVYHDYKDVDGFLYITYCGESVFGVSSSSI